MRSGLSARNVVESDMHDYDWIMSEEAPALRHFVVTAPEAEEDDDCAFWEQRLAEIRAREQLRVGKSRERYWRTLEDKVAYHNARAHNRGGGACLTVADWMRLRDAFGGQCAYCRGPGCHIEHVVPVSRGGGTSIWNLVPACERCNMSKRRMDPTEWLSPERLAEFIALCIEVTEAKNPTS